MKKIFLVILGLVLCFSSILFAQEVKKIDKDAYFAKVTSLFGEVLVKKVDAKDWVNAEKNMQLAQEDGIKTGISSNAEVEIVMAGAVSIMKIKEQAEIKISALCIDKRSDKSKTLLDLEIGEIIIKAKRPARPSSFEVKTPTSIVGVRGTVFSVNVIQI